jgi:anti-sigma factor RsiW
MKSPDEIRDLFSDALEGELAEADKKEFDAALAGDAALKEEYEAFRSLFRGTAAIANTTEAETDEKEPALLAGVQERLHKRSKGRFYRDRFSRDAGGRSATWLLLILIVLMLAIVIVSLQNMVVIETGPSAPVAPAPVPTSADS